MNDVPTFTIIPYKAVNVSLEVNSYNSAVYCVIFKNWYSSIGNMKKVIKEMSQAVKLRKRKTFGCISVDGILNEVLESIDVALGHVRVIGVNSANADTGTNDSSYPASGSKPDTHQGLVSVDYSLCWHLP